MRDMGSSQDRIREQVIVDRSKPEDAEEILKVIEEGWVASMVDEKRGADREAVEHLFKQAREIGLLKNFKKDIETEKGSKFLVAKKNNLVVGILQWEETPESNTVISFFVKPEARGAGIPLLHGARRTMNPEKNVTLQVAASKEDLHTFYKGLKFEFTGKDTYFEWETPKGKYSLHQLEMARKLR